MIPLCCDFGYDIWWVITESHHCSLTVGTSHTSKYKQVALLYHRGNLLPLVSSMVLVGKTKGLGLVEGFESPPNSVQVDNSPSNFPRMAESLREDSLSVVRLGVDLIRPSSSGNVA